MTDHITDQELSKRKDKKLNQFRKPMYYFFFIILTLQIFL